MKNTILSLEANQDFEASPYAPRRMQSGFATLKLELALNDQTFEKIMRAFSAHAKAAKGAPIYGSALALPELLAILVSELEE